MAGQESVTLDSIERLLNNKLNTRGRGSGRPWKNRGHGGFNRGKGSFRSHPYNNFAQSNNQGKRLLYIIILIKMQIFKRCIIP